jgi:hypothetical protein
MKLIEINGVNQECYPLAPAQKMHFYTVMACGKPQVLNIGSGLYIQIDIDFPVLKEAIYDAYQRHECSRLRFHQEEDKSLWQYVVQDVPSDIELHDYRHWAKEDIDKRLTEYTKIPFNMYDTQLNRVIMVQMPDGYNGIYINVQHMTMDSSSLFLFFRDIIEIYCAKKYPEQVKYPEAMKSYIECLKNDLKYPETKAFQRDSKYWQQALNESEPMYTDFAGMGRIINARRESGNPDKRSAQIVSTDCTAQISVYSLEREPSKQIVDFCREKNIPVVCMLLMGLRTVLSIFNENEKDVSIKTTIARRGTLLERNSGGTRIHYFPCRTIIEPTETFADGIKKIQVAQNTIFRHANYDPVQLTMERSKAMKLARGESYESISLTYQPLSGQNDGDNELPAKYKSQWYSNGVAAQPIYLTVMHRPEDNGLDFYFEHQPSVVNKEELDVLYYYICRTIFRGMENYDKPLKNILELV